LETLALSLKPLEAFRRLCLLTTIQHVHQLQEVKSFYEKNGKEVVLNEPNGRTKRPGQILGCNSGNVPSIDKGVDAFVYFGGGTFHPIGALLQTTKPFLIMDPFQRKAEFIDSMREAYKKRSKGKVVSALGAKRFGILVSTKNGQYRMDLAKSLKKKVEDAGIEAGILVSNTFDFDSINNMLEFDAFVNTACPRLALEDNDRMRKPLLSAEELATVLELKKES